MGSGLRKIGVPPGTDTYAAALEGLVEVNDILLDRLRLPPIYDAGVTYKNKPHAVWRNAGDVYGDGWGDCEDLSAWRVAELRRTGEDRLAHVAVYPTGVNRYHAVVMRGNGKIEDPSEKLGMPIRDRAMYEAKIVKNFGPGALTPKEFAGPIVGVVDDPLSSATISFDLYRRKDGWSGVFRVPFVSGRALLAQTALVPSAGQAQAQGAALAAQTVKTLAEQVAKGAGPALTDQAKRAVTALATQEGQKLLKNVAEQGLKAAASFVPGGSAAISVLSNPAVQNLGKAAASSAGKAAKSVASKLRSLF